MYQNMLDLKSLSNKEWRFLRGDESIIADRVKLRDDGVIEGHYHPNEVGWAICEDAVVFLDIEGNVSTAFHNMTYRRDSSDVIDVVLKGNFRATSEHHILKERAAVETADHDPASVERSVEIIRGISARLMTDVEYLEHSLIPQLGLNNEMLNEQPPELFAHFGKGMFLWQYPNQFAKYLAWLTVNATEVQRFAEIGCRWGGTFIVVSEWLRRVSPNLSAVIAIDPISPSPFMKRYLEISGDGGVQISYLQEYSTSEKCTNAFFKLAPDMVFIDGDHDLFGALKDHLLARKTANIIVHHDVVSDACPHTVLLWRAIREMEGSFQAVSFDDQYPTVDGNYLGIGCLKRI